MLELIETNFKTYEDFKQAFKETAMKNIRERIMIVIESKVMVGLTKIAMVNMNDEAEVVITKKESTRQINMEVVDIGEDMVVSTVEEQENTLVRLKEMVIRARVT